MKNKTTEAIIYVRVSDQKQIERGDGLRSQERACRDYAKLKGYEVVRVFEDVLTGGQVNRPGIREVKKYLKKNRGTVLIIDHPNRLSREVLGYLLLRADIEHLGGILESPGAEFKSDPSSKLAENIVASVSQYQREFNAEQTAGRMRSRVANGYACFRPPVGYRYEAGHGPGKLMVIDEPVASVVRDALEGFAAGRFENQAAVQRFLQDNPLFPRPKSGRVLHQRVRQMLRQPMYAGYIQSSKWACRSRRRSTRRLSVSRHGSASRSAWMAA